MRSTPSRLVSDDDASHVLGLLDELGARAYAQRIAEVYRDHALAELPSPESGNAGDEGLRLLARHLVNRVYGQPAQA